MLPGPLGLTTRRCACGTQLPNTIRAAARTLPTLCPYCNRELAGSSGVRHTVQLPVIGSVGAGKTRLLMAAIVQLESWLTERQGSINAVTPDAQTYLDAARLTVHSHAETVKTPSRRSPADTPRCGQRGNRTPAHGCGWRVLCHVGHDCRPPLP
jgi:hypothetical protein